jgi:hypothetical protein
MAPSNESVAVARPTATTTSNPPLPSEVVATADGAASRTTTVIEPANGQHPWLRFEKLYSRDDAQIREWLDIIEERRRQDDIEFQRELESE